MQALKFKITLCFTSEAGQLETRPVISISLGQQREAAPPERATPALTACAGSDGHDKLVSRTMSLPCGSCSRRISVPRRSHFLKLARKRAQASTTLARSPKALIRMKPWPAGPKPTPGVVTTCGGRVQQGPLVHDTVRPEDMRHYL